MKRQERESEDRSKRKQRVGGGGANKFTKLQSITDGINNDHVSRVYPQYKTSKDFSNDHLFLLDKKKPYTISIKSDLSGHLRISHNSNR